ncbi:MAG: glycoside hydrolase family 25 protein, partial [Rhodanobacteraceae bacterium]
VQFAYAKATEGTGYADAQFADNHDDAKTRGIPFGAYHFFHFGQDPIAQAQHFLASTDGRRGTLLPMVDVEGGGQDGVSDLGALIRTLAAFNTEIERAVGAKILIYSDYGDWNAMMGGTDAFAGHPFWVAEYNSDAAPALPTGITRALVWQFSSSGRIPGIAGNVDLDRFLGEDLREISLT